MKTRTHFRVITPGSYCNLDGFKDPNDNDYWRGIKTKEDAQLALDVFGNVGKDSEHYDYWQDVKSKCSLARVTEIVESDIDSNINYASAPELLHQLQVAVNHIKNIQKKYKPEKPFAIGGYELAIQKATK